MQHETSLNILFFTYGGPEKPEDVPEFVRNIMGKRASEELLQFNVKRYRVKGALESQAVIISLIDRVKKLIVKKLDAEVFIAARHWHPYLRDVAPKLLNRKKTVVFVTTIIQSEVILQPYLNALHENVKSSFILLRGFHKFDKLIEYLSHRAERIIGKEKNYALIFTAHSLPAASEGASTYREEFEKLACEIASRTGTEHFRISFQSIPRKSKIKWLEPEVGEVAREEAQRGRTLIFYNLNFFSENVETLYDLDVQVKKIVQKKGAQYIRIPQPGSDSVFAEVIADFIHTKLGS